MHDRGSTVLPMPSGADTTVPRPTTAGTDRQTSLIPAYPLSSELTDSTRCSSQSTASMIGPSPGAPPTVALVHSGS
jgi:hypothetical protein